MNALPTLDRMYQAIVEKDESFVGIFYVAVKTTGIFCRPGCPARTPFQRNVEFFQTASASLHAGYRPCLRCRPMDAGLQPPAWVRELIKRIDQSPHERITNTDLRKIGIEPEKARRTFKSRYGMTFQAYSRSRRLGQALGQVRKGQDVFTTALDHGYESDSGFREAFEKVFGTTVRSADGIRSLDCRWIETPLGPMFAVADEKALVLLEFIDRRMLETQLKTVQRRFGCVLVPGNNDVLLQTETEINEYFAGERKEFTVPLDLRGTPFQEKVWESLLRIPYGKVVSYSDTARDIGDANAVRAVGKANGDNRIAIIVPCHRVIRADGTLCGYGGGLWRKKRLLDLESAQPPLL